ncbi:MAG: hypothetical protein M3340_12895 [Actinomycetota bacterium]|nr:hypothetical protein [Actinomycetota bacterium]
MAAHFRVRRFLYLNADLVQTSLAQVEGGVFDAEDQSTTAAFDKKLGAGLGVGPAKAEASRGRSGEETISREIRLTADANFSRLANRLEDEGAVQVVEDLDQPAWDTLRRGDILELEGSLSMPTAVQWVRMVQQVDVPEMMEAFGEAPDTEMIEGLAMMEAFGQMLKTVPVIVTTAGTPSFKFIANLDPQWLRDDGGELDGEAVVYGTLEKKLKKGERWSLIDAMGLGALPRQDKRQAEQGLAKIKEMKDSIVRGPASFVTPLAIYR